MKDPMTFDEAIVAPGRKFLLLVDEVRDGKRLVMIYSVGDTGTQRLAWRQVPVDELAAVVADLSARGLELAEYDFHCDFIWKTKGDGIEVYSSKGKVFEAEGDRATLKDWDGRVIARTDIAKVIAFAEDDYVYRGVKARLRSGQEVPLVTEASGAAMGDPTYSRNELLVETVWASTIGTTIATWADAPFEDLI
jgi:hypothetical protein